MHTTTITDPVPARYFTGLQFMAHQQSILHQAELRPLGGTDRLRRFVRRQRPA